MTCDCAEEIDDLLQPRGERLDLAFNTAGRLFYVVKIAKRLGGRGKVTLMLASYCPFCGKKQEKNS